MGPGWSSSGRCRRPRRPPPGCLGAPGGRLLRGRTGMIESRAPQNNEQGHLLGEVEAVSSGNTLAIGANHGAQRRQESLAAVGFGKGWASPRATSVMSVPGLTPTAERLRPMAAADLSPPGLAVAPMKRSAPGRAAARRTGLTSGPRPPLETSTRRSTISGNW